MTAPFPVCIENPKTWWVACRRELPMLVDPDVEDDQQRHDDRDLRDWGRIAVAVQTVADALRGVRSDQSGNPLTVAVDVQGMHQDDIEILESWLVPAIAPCADPWSAELTNGRHRLWNVWLHRPRARLPIYSSFLAYGPGLLESDAARENFAAEARVRASGLRRGIRRRAPTFYRALCAAADGVEVLAHPRCGPGGEF